MITDMPIQFFSEETTYNLPKPDFYKKWIHTILAKYDKIPGEISYIFCSDDYLLEINRQHLGHDFYTDIITFDHSEAGEEIAGDIFISVDRVQENSKNYDVGFPEELSRVMTEIGRAHV